MRKLLTYPFACVSVVLAALLLFPVDALIHGMLTCVGGRARRRRFLDFVRPVWNAFTKA